MDVSQGAKRRMVTGRWNLVYRVLASTTSVLLVFWADGRFHNYQTHVASSFNPTGNLWRWFTAAAFLLVAGVLMGLAIRKGHPTGGFDWRRLVTLGLIPGLLAMTLPTFVWGWPMTTMGSPLWSFRTEFLDDGTAAVMWLLVGLAVASGFETSES